MPEQNTQFVEYIKENFTGDTQKNALNFVQHITSLGMTGSGSMNDGQFVYKGVKVCNTYFGNSSHNPGYPEPWTMWGFGDYSKEVEGVQIDERMKEIAWLNLCICDDCKASWCNRSEKREIVFDRDFENICHGAFCFTDPNADEVACMKSLMEMQKCAIDIKFA